MLYLAPVTDQNARILHLFFVFDPDDVITKAKMLGMFVSTN